MPAIETGEELLSLIRDNQRAFMDLYWPAEWKKVKNGMDSVESALEEGATFQSEGKKQVVSIMDEWENGMDIIKTTPQKLMEDYPGAIPDYDIQDWKKVTFMGYPLWVIYW